MEIQLIIRAPNQNIDDQAIRCNMEWTILKLKKHLSEVYPSKPVIQEQKLIYSGHLLEDHLQLKDIIRPEDTVSNVHIFHLVYNGSYNLSAEQSPASSQECQFPTTHSTESSAANTHSSPENVLRYRPHSFVSQVNNSPMPASTLPLFSDSQTIAQMAVMQQMYAQYMSQYWQSMNIASTGNSMLPLIPNLQPQQNMPNNAVIHPIVQQPANEGNNAVGNQNFENNAAGNQDWLENEFLIRDWLDNIFAYCRFFILFSIAYFYTTPERFMLMVLCAVVALLYHEGWFMRQTIEDVIRMRNARAPHPADDGQVLEAAMDEEDPPHANNLDDGNNNEAFSPLTFLVAFFFSLVPETPPPPVDIN